MKEKNNIFDGLPSIILKQRPFFSIIIPCYNSGDTLRTLLESIEDQNMNDEIEIILSDDHSTDKFYQDIVDEFSDILSIRQIKTDYNFAPGNTREKGVSIAEGQWVIFADHDDEFVPGTLPIVKQILLESGEQYYAVTNFIERNPDTEEVIREMKGSLNWNHGKFYNLDNLWKAFDIHFKKDLLTHEDIYISSTVNCVMRALNTQPLFIDLTTYIWNARPTTVSREIYGDYCFLETFFKDYIDSTGTVYLDMFNLDNIDLQYTIESSIDIILYCYFYIQSFMFREPNNYKKENVDYARDYLIRAKELLGIDNSFIYNFAASNEAYEYKSVEQTAFIASGPFIPQYSFAQWLDYLHKDIKPKITMSDSMHK